MKLAILIPTLPSRKDKFDLLVNELIRQVIESGWVYRRDVKIIYDEADRNVKTIGAKRNTLMSLATNTAKSEYVCFIDDDDRVSPNYIKHLKAGIESGVDCCSFRGVITENGQNPQVFEHALKYKEWRTNQFGEIRYERYPNHLNCIKTSIASQFLFPHTSYGEDHVWATKIHESGLIKTEHYIDEIIYFYDYVSNK
jgi:glycosyltransferase involved in cell wall biosynthesis